MFGQIKFSSRHGIDMWCHLPNETAGHMIIVNASANGPSQAQRDFYSKLQVCLPQREAECKAFISRHKAPPENLSTMTIYSVEIGREEEVATGRLVIELSDAEANEIHRVEFVDGQPKNYTVDD